MLLAVLVLAAAVDPAAAFRDSLREADAREAAWWKEFPDRQKRALEAWHEPLRTQYARGDTVPRPDFAPVETLYAGLLDIERSRADAFRALAASGDPAAPDLLLDRLLAAVDAAEAADAANAPGATKVVGFQFDQEPSLRRHALGRREEALLDALASAPGSAEALLGRGWERAAAADGARRTRSRRVAVIDALARRPEPAAAERLHDLLAEEDPGLRIAALEACIARRTLSPADAARLLSDPVPAVRFALLEEVRRPAADSRWIPPLVDALPAATGRARVEILRDLRILAGEDAGDDPAAWRAWLDRHRGPVEAGTHAPEPGASISTRRPPPGPAPWDVPLGSDRVLFAIDGWHTLFLPADHEFQRTRHATDWVTGDRGWRRTRESHQEVAARLFAAAARTLPAEAGLRLLLAGDAGNRQDLALPFPVRGFLPGGEASARKVREAVLDHRPGNARSFQFLLGAALAEEADTVLLVSSGDTGTCRFLLPDAFLEEFRRRRRFRRVRFHVVRVCDTGPEAGRILEEVARSSGGEFRWAKMPPPR
ncbi:MAG: HEAT repeat domain-containing protein [Planctomycetes bacterium]|nr:HEAT repeat domain-containing protein [Planctomycetota bacterium]